MFKRLNKQVIFMKIEKISHIQPNNEYEMELYVKHQHSMSNGTNFFTVTDGTDEFKLVSFQGDYGIQTAKQYSFTFSSQLYQGQLQGKVEKASRSTQNTIKEKLIQQYKPKNDELLLDTPAFNLLKTSMIKTASLIREAIISQRPIILSHHADADGFCAGLLIEQAVTGLFDSTHKNAKSQFFITRNSSKTPYYSVVDATRDIGFFQQNTERKGVVAPLIVIIDNGSTYEDLLAIRKVQLFGADVVVIDHHHPGTINDGRCETDNYVLSHVNPHLHGLDKGLSASMLCYQVAYYIDSNKPDCFVAALGGVADKGESEELDMLVKQSNKSIEYYKELSIYVAYEIFQTKFGRGAIADMILGSDKLREELVGLYKPIMQQEEERIRKMLDVFMNKEQLGKYLVHTLDADQTTLWGDYFTIGKLAAIASSFTEAPSVILVTSESMIVIRVNQQEPLFDVNVIVQQLQHEYPEGRITGGGHAVAGTIRYIPAMQKTILDRLLYIIREL